MRRIDQCSARGPYREHCTDHAGHRYAHYDASKDTSWTDHKDDHRDGCECDLHRPDLHEDEWGELRAAVARARAEWDELRLNGTGSRDASRAHRDAATRLREMLNGDQP